MGLHGLLQGQLYLSYRGKNWSWMKEEWRGENHEIFAMISGVTSEIRTEDLPNIRLEFFFFCSSHSGGWSPNWVHSARRPFILGLLYLPRVIVRMENLVE
jgi:hypothetical protein